VQADRSNSPTAVVRVKKAAADALMAIGKPAEAKKLAEEARAALGDAAPDDAFGVLVTLLVAGVDDDGLVVEAVGHASASLPEMSAWWELPRLLPFVKRALERGGKLDAAALSAVLSAAAQRPDCADLVTQIRALSSG